MSGRRGWRPALAARLVDGRRGWRPAQGARLEGRVALVGGLPD